MKLLANRNKVMAHVTSEMQPYFVAKNAVVSAVIQAVRAKGDNPGLAVNGKSRKYFVGRRW